MNKTLKAINGLNSYFCFRHPFHFILISFLAPHTCPISIRLFYFTDDEFVFKDQWGGISIMRAANLSTRTLMSNQTYVSNTRLLVIIE